MESFVSSTKECFNGDLESNSDIYRNKQSSFRN